MLIIQFPYMEIVWLAFKKKVCEKKLWTINSTAGKTFKRFLGCYNWKLWLFFIFVFWKKTLVIQFPYMEIVWLAFFWWRRQKFFKVFLKLPPKIFCVFSIANWFLYSNKHLKKKKFCMQNLIFCVYNVVLDILILDFFSFSLHNFFQKLLKLLFLLYDMFLYALINVW